LVGTKSDKFELKKVSEEEAKSFAKEINAIYQLVSAKDGKGINELFYYIGKKYSHPNWNQKDEKKENKIRRENDNNCILL
jgi:Asp-tRNA(Asn)/Glu-tRNA(Gln) amidotransferase C subunit